MSYNLTNRISIISAAQRPRGPPVIKAGLAPLGPWAMFLTWDQPVGADPTDLWAYKLDFGSFAVNVPATSKLMMHTQDTGISPGQQVSVAITARYNRKADSASMSLGLRALPAGKFLDFVF